jgi:hypothetical protein
MQPINANTHRVAKKLRPYQVRLVTDVCRITTGDVLVEQPTGSGKTVQIVTLVAMHLGRHFTHALIAAPQEQIEDGFVKRDYREIAFPDYQGVAVPSIQVPKALINGARESRLGSVKRVIQYLRQPGPLDHAFACTHAALNRLTAKDLPGDLAGKALFIDEAHHASADGLAELVTLWRERGGQLFFFTATPYRGDGRPVRLEGMKVFRRSLAEHMAEGFAPRQLESEIVALGQPGDAITAAQFTGEEAPPSSYFEGLVAAICRRWLEDDRPKAIVRVPPMRGGRSGTLVGRLIEALSSQGARVLDATGTGRADKQRFLAGLEAEKNRTFATSKYDVMVGIQRVLEGTDWPVCGAVYCVGMPGSLNTVVQFLGRAMRLKGDDYPAARRDRARLVFFVPCGGGAALADLSIDHSRHALLTCCFLADHEVGQEWIVLREVQRGIEKALGDPAENPVAADAENDAAEALDPEVRAEVELAIACAREQIVERGEEPTLGKVLSLTAESRPDLPELALQRVAVEALASLSSPRGKKACHSIRQEIASKLRINPVVKKAMESAFAAVLEEFRNETLEHSTVLKSVGRQMHGVTGRQMREFAGRLRNLAERPLTEEQIVGWADFHHRSAGKWPNVSSGPIHGTDETWSGLNAALQNGLRGLPGGSSLARLLTKHRGVRNRMALPKLTHDQILNWADLHHDRTGIWPTRLSGSIIGTSGENWSAVNAVLHQGGRGLKGGSSLARLLHKHRGVPNRMALPELTVEQILEWADSHHARTGRWPIVKSGAVVGLSGEKWNNIDAALTRGARGLPGGSSLAQLLHEYRAVRNRAALADLTLTRILKWADAHHERTNSWPKLKSGRIAESSGETWYSVNSALQQGLRGLPGGSSLALVLDEHRGVKNMKAQRPLTILQILAWVDDHCQSSGRFPTLETGSVAAAPGEQWRNIDNALKLGLRGLSGRSSLARIIKEHRKMNETSI